MPTTLANAVLGTLPDGSLPVRGPDRLAAVVPMYDEEAGAARALAALFAQTVPLDEVVVSIHGGRDRTPEVVDAALAAHGFACVERTTWGAPGVPLARWRREGGGPDVVVVRYAEPTSKADGLNRAVAGGLVGAERVLVVDGDTVLDPGFVAAVRDGFYRLRQERVGRGRARWVLEDVALVSGAVTSARPDAAGPAARFVAAARGAEYAMSVAIRRGQAARLGRGATFGASRLFTTVGCGFVARRASFPIPADTRTEDHDFTVQVQSEPSSERSVDVAALHARGFRVVVAGAPRPLADVVDGSTLAVRRGAQARFEAAATMATEDPRHLAGYLLQVERWVGGALEVVAKRAGTRARRRALPPNVRFALLAAQLENVAGLLLLLALPAALGLALPWAGADGVVRKAAAWLLADVGLTGALVFLGAWLHARARGDGPGRAFAGALGRTVRGLGPLLALRPVNALAYATSLAWAMPRVLGWLRPRVPSTVGLWRRPSAAPPTVRRRSVAVAVGMSLVAGAGFVASAWPAWGTDASAREAWRAVRSEAGLHLDDVATLPIVAQPRPPVAVAVGLVVDAPVVAAEPVRAAGFCSPAVVASAAPQPRRLTADGVPYAPLGAWAAMTLARLVPVAHALEEAATAYDVPAVLLLQVLLNESYLDPMAVGPTDDVGLAQVTTDALRLLRAISTDRRSPFANPTLFAGPFSAFDPEFSVCAGAAKLAWARAGAGGRDDHVAYARYVNPVDGVVAGAVSERHRPLVAAFAQGATMAHALAATFDAYRADPAAVAPRERALLEVADAVAAGALDVEGAYRAVQAVARTHGVEDPGFYERVIAGLYEERLATAEPADVLAAAP